MKILYSLFFLASIIIQSQYYVGIDKSYQISNASYYNEPTITSDGYLFVPDRYSLTKLLPNGKRDTEFGFNGSLDLSFSKVYVKDQSLYVGVGNNIYKYDFKGVKDNSFGTNGTLTANNVSITKIIDVNNDGTILFKSPNSIQRLLPTGNIDNSFSSIISTKEYITSNNQIIVQSSNLLKKYDLSDGHQILDFGNQGEITIPQNSSWTINKSTDDIFILSKTGILSLMKYRSDGLIDSNFGINGIATASYNIGLPITINGFTTDSQNKILIYGGYRDFLYPASFILRLNEDGSYDPNFNNGSDFLYQKNYGDINYFTILNDNKYLGITTISGLGTSIRSTQFLRTQNPNEILLSVTDIINESKVSIYPNPVKDIFDIKLSSNENLQTVKLFDASGKLILTSRSTKNNISQLNKGIYYLEVTTSSNSYKTKIIKN